LYGISELEFVCRSCETDAGGRPADRRFVQDAQSGMRLAESGVETKSRLIFRQTHATLRVESESPSSRSTASVAVSQPRQTHERSVTPYNAFAVVPQRT